MSGHDIFSCLLNAMGGALYQDRLKSNSSKKKKKKKKTFLISNSRFFDVQDPCCSSKEFEKDGVVQEATRLPLAASGMVFICT